jgi:predicted alpha/beta superfamily hydrolase
MAFRLVLATLLAAPLALSAQESATLDTFTIPSKGVAEPRPINVHLPAGYAADGTIRYPVLYMPDGGMHEDLPHVAKTVDSLAALGKIRPVIIVGIPNTERRRDMTGPTRSKSDSAIAARVGGSNAFRRFIAEELIPEIDRRYRTTPERAIIGESLAGLFIVETFLLTPQLFDHYIALDPSLWWDRGSLAASAGTRLAAFDGRARSIYLASSNVADIATPTAQVADLIARSGKRVRSTYLPRTDLTHATIYLALAPESLMFALGVQR